jgi:hypothetical protein
VTPTDGAGAVPAGGGSSLPLPGGPGIDPAGIMTGARGASLKRDAKAKVTPSHCIARSAARIEPRQMAEASAAVGRRKASALRSARGRAPLSTDDWCAFSALRLPLFFLEAKDQWLWSAKLGRGLRRGNESARTIRPRDSGGGKTITSSASAWRCRSGFLLCLRRRAARFASTRAPAGS